MYSQLTSTLSSCNRVTTGLIMLLCVFLSQMHGCTQHTCGTPRMFPIGQCQGKKRKTDNCTNLFVIPFLLRMHRHWLWLYSDYMFCMPATEQKRVLRGLATAGPPAKMREEVRAKERGVWIRLTNQLYPGNGTNHGSSLGLCCSLFISPFPYISALFTSLPNHPFLPRFFPPLSISWIMQLGSVLLLSFTPTSIVESFLSVSLPFPHQPSAGFLIHNSPCFKLGRLWCRLQSLRSCTHHPSQCTNSQRAESVAS